MCCIGYSLSGHKNMIMKVNPDLVKARHLRIWYDAGGRLSNNQITTTQNGPVFECLDIKFYLIGISFFILASWKTIGEIEKEQLGRKNRPDYVSVKATCMHIANDRVVYTVC